MKKYFLILFIFLSFLSFNTYSEVAIKYKDNNIVIKKNLPDGSFGAAFTINDSIIQTVILGPNIEKDVIVEFKTPPIKTFKGQKKFDFKSNGLLSEKINSEQLKFISDLEQIISYKEMLSTPALNDANYKINFQYKIALNGIALKTSQWVIDEIKKLDYVKNIQDIVEVKINDDISNQVISADDVWYTLGATGSGILIAIIDTGIDSSHTVLNNRKVIGGYNFISNNTNFFDDHGHGTHCAGIAAANGNGLSGVAPDASLLAVKVLNAGGSGSSDQIVAGIEYALDPDGNPNTNDGADVISMSLGGGGSPDDAMSTAVNNAVANGVFCSIAAGNNGSGLYTIQSPGCAHDVMTVGASNNNNNMADFSSRGPNGNAFEIKPDVTAPGVSIYSSVPNNGYESMSGTSMATPHVAGAAALIKQLHPDWTPQQIKSALMGTANNISNARIWDQGSGRINVFNAAQTNSILEPSSIGFGLIPYSQDIWSKTDTLTLHNVSDYSISYNLSLDYNFPAGFSYSIEPNEVTIDANSSAEIIFTISVDNSIFPLSESNPPTYNGKIVVEGGNQILKTNFVFAKARMLNISFDEIPNLVIIHNRRNIYYSYSWKQYINQVVPRDTLDILAYFNNFSADYYVVRERIPLVSDTGYNIMISKSEAVHHYPFRYYNENNIQTYGTEIGTLDIGYNYYGFTMFGGMAPNLYFSDFSSDYKFYNTRIAYILNNNNNYDSYATSFSLKNGIYESDSIKISSNNSKKIKQKYYLENKTDDFWMRDWVGTYYFMGSVSIPQSIRYPYERNYYYHFYADNNYYIQNEFVTNVNDINTGFLLSPYIKIYNDKVQYLDMNRVDTLFSFTSDTSSINIGKHYPVFKSKMNNTGTSINLNSENQFILTKPAIFQDAFGYNLQKGVTITLKDVFGYVIDSVRINNIINNNYENSSIGSGYYELNVEYDSTKILDYYGKAKATLTFNTSNNDKNPPYIKKFNITSDSIVSDNLYKGKNYNVECKIYDDYGINSVNFYYKELNSNNWLPLNVNSNSNTYYSSINITDFKKYFSFKIVAIDNSENTLVYELMPAFYVNVSAPTLISPIDTVLQDTYPTFIWNKVCDNAQYTVQVSTNSNFSNLIINNSIYDTSYASEISLNYNKTYYWRVKAAYDNGISPWSEVWNFKTILYTISLNAGWNYVSSFVIPDNPNLDTMFNSIIDDLVVVKINNNQLYYPQYNINLLGDWDYKKGYRVYVLNPVEFTIYGTDAVPETTQINLSAGWNLVAYLRKSPMPIEEALSSIYNNIRIIKNSTGELALPGYGYDKIEYMYPNIGYWIYLNAPSVLVYPAN